MNIKYEDIKEHIEDPVHKQAWKGCEVYLAKNKMSIEATDQEDIRQLVFERFWKKKDKIDRSKSMRSIFSWGYTLAYNTVIMIHRYWDKRRLFEIDYVPDVDDVGDVVERNESIHKLMEYLKSHNQWGHELVTTFIESKGSIRQTSKRMKMSKRKVREKINELRHDAMVENILWNEAEYRGFV